MSSKLQTIEEHILIRDTIGYDGIRNIDVFDLPTVMEFLKIVNNYNRMSNIMNK